MKIRADLLLVERGLAPSRERAQALIMAGCVRSGDRRIEKAGQQLPMDAPLSVVSQDHPFVSRGGVKLAGALDALQIDPAGWVVADFGASTGGFTDCLLQRNAKKVFAIDVGYGQLHEKLRCDPRVVVMERTNARNLQPTDLTEAVDLVVIDASFISVTKLLPAARRILAPCGRVLAMVKPQFEVGRENVSKGGVVHDDALRHRAVDDVARFAKSCDLQEVGRIESALAGPKGNREIFVLLGDALPDSGEGATGRK